MASVDFHLRDDDGRLVIEALAELPFKDVFELIGELNRQAVGAELEASGRDDGRRYQVGRDHFALLLEALAQLPYARVHRLLASLARQLESQRGKPA